MKSRITIEVDFENGNQPVIQIIQQNSEDVRDNLLKSFLQSLQHTSRWCCIEYKGNYSALASQHDIDDTRHRWFLVPIVPQSIEQEISLMTATLREYKKGLSNTA